LAASGKMETISALKTFIRLMMEEKEYPAIYPRTVFVV
jgi:hypothetical protein